MKLLEVKKKTLQLIEEYSPDSDNFTDDPDIAGKLNSIIGQVQFELSRLKKIPRYVEMPVIAGDTVTFGDIGKACGNSVFQLGTVRGVQYDNRAGGTVLKIRTNGVAEIDCFVYPKPITEETQDDHEMELSEDALEIMPYGVAADLLKSDVSSNYGAFYKERYETMLQRLDSRYVMPSISMEGGYDI